MLYMRQSIVIILCALLCIICDAVQPPLEPYDLSSGSSGSNSKNKKESQSSNKPGWSSEAFLHMINNVRICIANQDDPKCVRFNIKMMCQLKHELSHTSACPLILKPACQAMLSILRSHLKNDGLCQKHSAYTSKKCATSKCTRSQEEIVIKNIFQSLRNAIKDTQFMNNFDNVFKFISLESFSNFATLFTNLEQDSYPGYDSDL